MITYTLLIVLGFIVIGWLYALIFSDLDEVPTSFRGNPVSNQTRFWLGVFLFPFVQFYRLLRWLLRCLKHITVDVIFEMIVMGFLQFIWFLMRALFLMIFRIFD